MEEIIIYNGTKKWLECIDIFDVRRQSIASKKNISIPPNAEITVRDGDKSKKLIIMIGISIKKL